MMNRTELIQKWSDTRYYMPELLAMARLNEVINEEFDLCRGW